MAERAPDIALTILGSGTGLPSLERSACSVLVETGGKKILIDSGPGTMRRLLEAGTRIFELSHVFYSHFHPDHTAELAPMLFATRYPAGPGRSEPLTLVAGRGFEDFLSRLRHLYGSWIDIGAGLLSVVEMDTGEAGRRGFGAFELATAPMRHNPESLGFRLTGKGGRSIVYSGDTDACEALVELSRGADILVCESAFPDSLRVGGHLTPGLAGEIAERAGVGRLVLTHFYPACEGADLEAECRKTYRGPLSLARDLMRFSLD
jgi:ribonuclease BN (tRNA processing enzyme)